MFLNYKIKITTLCLRPQFFAQHFLKFFFREMENEAGKVTAGLG